MENGELNNIDIYDGCKELYSFKETCSPSEFLEHYGMPRRSGRFPWGSGKDPYQHGGDFISRRDELKAKGLSEKEMVEALNLKSVSELRAKYTIALNERRMHQYETVKSMKEDGLGATEIGRRLGISESTVRSILDQKTSENLKQLNNTADFLRKQVDANGMVEIGTGVEHYVDSTAIGLGLSRTKFDTAVAMLEEEGYVKLGRRVAQQTNPGKFTTIQVLAVPGTEPKDVFERQDEIASLVKYQSLDGGNTFELAQYPASLDSSRVLIRYGEEGGSDKDGVIELRPGVDDISLGNSHYAQVRIMVDDKYYMKGMAMYANDIPKGYDVVYNSNKSIGTPKEKVFKELKTTPDGNIDIDNPFGALIKRGGQSPYIDINGNEKLRVINKLREEGEWEDYNKNISPQMLAKQKKDLITRQLDLSYKEKLEQFEVINSLTNPVIKKNQLESFADDCDAAAVHLKAAALPRQTTKVLLPVPTLKDNEIYAPTFNNGERVVLIRYPHGGTFEIPELVVNNTHEQAKKSLGNAPDAVGINFNVASKLSGADFDGDTAIIIPVNNKVRITTSKTLPELEGFDPKSAYPYHEGMRVLSEKQKQKEMGKVSNLITDMTIKGAQPDEIARAVKHSMVVIDATKHKLDYKSSEVENDIQALKNKYQAKVDKDGNAILDKNGNPKQGGGASTLLSMAKSEERVPKRKDHYYSKNTIDQETGEKIYTYTNEKNLKGELVTTKSTKMAETKNAYTLSSGSKVEELYAEYANNLKSLANQARKEYLRTPNMEYDPSAAKTYAAEVKSLNAKLVNAKKNAPKERMAQLLADNIVKIKVQDNPNIDKDELKKIKAQTLAKTRVETGAHKERVTFTDREWEAIQAGAISGHKLREILMNANDDEVKKLATPKRQNNTVSNAQESRIRAMAASGYTIAEIAASVGLSTSTVGKYMKGKER